jgi:hypothetical protein
MNNNANWSLKDLLQILLKAKADYKWFGTRKVLNEESALFLPRSKEFTADVAVVRKEFNVPRLNPDKDYIVINNTGFEIEDSYWLSGKPTEFINRWEQRIKELIDSHHLPESFRDWVEMSILYEKPKYYPHYNFEAILEILNNPQEANRIGLTTGEKEFILFVLRGAIQSTKGKRETTLKREYSILKGIIAKSKNTRRRLRTIKTSLKTLEMGTKKTYFDEAVGSNVTHKTTSEDLATRIFKDETGEKAPLVRKQKERLLKRHI